jgi:hypothetical protein
LFLLLSRRDPHPSLSKSVSGSILTTCFHGGSV